MRFVNATNGNIDLIRDGNLSDGNLAFGNASRCIAVNARNPGLAFTNTGAAGLIPGFDAELVAGGAYLVIAWTGPLGATRFTTVRTDDFNFDAGRAALAFVNVIDGVQGYDVYVTTPGAVMGAASVASLVAGTPSRFFNVNPGALQVRFTPAGSSTVLLDAGNWDFLVRTTVVGVLAPALAPSTVLRAFAIVGC